ncbi:S1C family serine protease [Actinoplanes sp. NPDC049668]|uniref:S1C family serine protease n=1 Tax=unclassified Actinoplanes TaxID=2626549 RepID=UPI0033BED467
MTDLLTRPPYTQDHTAAAPPFPPLPPNAVSHRGTPRRWPRRVAGGAVVLALIAGGGTAGGAIAERYAADRPAAAARTTATGVPAVAANDDLAAVAAKVSPSIVTVLMESSEGSGLGSGVVISADGLIVTNNHVVASGGTASVRLADGRTVPAEVLATDPGHDLALVRASGAGDLTPATFGTDDSVAVGDTVLAFGAPLGLEGTVTSGIVSALDREVGTDGEKLTGLLQTDAAINHGNSGGALVDTASNVIGINVAIAAPSEDSGSIGLGFAIPADTVTSVVSQLEAGASH